MLRRAFLLASISLLACTSKFMHPAPAGVRIAPHNELATVVFVRPSSFGAAIHPTIFDEKGNFLGDAEPSAHFVSYVSPGEHMFVVWAENTGPIHATLLPGRVYFVEVSIKPGVWQARCHLLAITPRTEQWNRVREWLADTKPTIADLNAGQSYLMGRRDEVLDRVKRAHDAFGEMDEDERFARTISPEDGLAQGL
jgi:hypothetical protein